MNILITGANGFVGSFLVERLGQAGHSVTTITRKTHGDISQIQNWEKILKHHNIEIIVHLAALVHQMGKNLGLRDYKKINVETTQKLAKAASNLKVNTFIFLSSIKVNGEENPIQYTSDSVPSPSDPYGESKLLAERAIEEIAASSKTLFVTLRPPLIYGKQVKANMLKLVNLIKRGTPLPLALVKNQRSLLYIGNLVNSIETIIDSNSFRSGQNFTYLISDHDDCSTPTLIRDIAEVLSKRAYLIPIPLLVLKLVFQVLGRADQHKRIAHSLSLSPSLFMNDFKWKPPYTRKEGLRLSFQEHIDFQDK